MRNSNKFPVMFSQALVRKPASQNEVSGLMITGIFGGAIIPLLIGVTSDTMQARIGALIILLVWILFIISLASPKVRIV